MIEWLPSKPGTPMNGLGGAQRFQQLPADAQARHIGISQHLTRLARDHAVPIVFAPPPSIGGKINSASCVLQLDAGTFVVTASHVLIGYEERIRSGEVLHWLVGNLPPFDPLQRVARRGWTAYGVCVEGPMKGTRLKPLILEPEFWFAWSEFHPQTLLYGWESAR